MQRILILGPQGSGKGTQAELLAKKLGIPAISMGQLWRKEIEAGTEWGKAYTANYQGGKFASNEQTSELARRRLSQPDAQNGFVFDSYPRNLAQQKLSAGFMQLTQVIVLTLSDSEAIERLGGRTVCAQCGKNYHRLSNPPKREGICDEDRVALVVRSDDTPEAIKKRLEIYHADTEPLVEYYRKQGILLEIDSTLPIEKVHEDIMRALR